MSDIFGVTTDYLIKESAGEATDSTAEKQTAKKPSARMALCIVLLCIGMVGMLIFCMLSGLKPWGYVDQHGNEFGGLRGYLLGTNTTFFFVLCVLSALIGLGGLVYLSVQEAKTSV